MNTPTKLAATNQAVEKTLRIIEYLSQCESPVRLQKISAELDMPESTVCRLLNTLYVNNYVNQDPVTFRYSLSLKFTKIGELVHSHVSIAGLADKALIALSKRCEESANVAIELDCEVVYVGVIYSPNSILRATQQIGTQAPMHCNAIGKILLSRYDDDQLADYISKKGLPAYTNKTIVSAEELKLELQTIQKQGFAMDNGETEEGVCSIAAPIRNYAGKIVAGISITGSLFRFTPERIPSLREEVMSTALAISKRLAYMG